MYGIEIAVLSVACLFVVLALWTAPLWMRLLAALFARLSGRLDRVDEATDQKSPVYPREER